MSDDWPVEVCYVRFIIAEGDDCVMIGTSADPKRVVCALQMGNSRTLELVAVEKYGYMAAHERKGALHARFHRLHVRGSWFRLNDALSAIIDAAAVSDAARGVLDRARGLIPGLAEGG